MLNQTFTPLRDNLGQQVYQHLRDMIYRMEIPPGARLGVGEIADQFGVSRSPVRDALMMLVNRGLVEINSTGGYRVIQLDKPYIEDAFVVRRALELAAIRLCMDHLDIKRLKDLRATWVRMEKQDHGADQIERQILADQELHQALAEMSHNALLQDALDRITSITWLISRFTTARAKPQHKYGHLTAQEHIHVLDAMMSSDAKKAVAALDEHLTRAFRAFARATGDRPNESSRGCSLNMPQKPLFRQSLDKAHQTHYDN